MSYPETTIAAALAYAAKGWYVLPLIAGEKIPATKNGWHDATTDSRQIHEWFDAYPLRGVGISLEQSHIAVLDLDTHGDGIDGESTLRRLEAQRGAVMSQCRAIQATPSGGKHLLFANPDGIRLPAKLERDKGNIDVKTNGYICAYPSSRADCGGNIYEWEEDADPLADGFAGLSPLPRWIKDIGKPAELPLDAGANDARTTPGAVQPVTDYQWAEIVSALHTIPAIDRDTWLQVGFALQATGRPDARQVWDQWSATCPGKYSDDSQERAWRSFEPRGWEGVGYRTIFKLAQEGGWRGLSATEAAAFRDAPEASGAPLQVRKGKPCQLKHFDEVLPAAFHQRWLVKGYVPRGSIGVFYGRSGAGKSWAVLDLCLHMATGLQWCEKRTAQSKVLYIAAEGGVGAAVRVEAWRLAHKVSREDINSNFYIIPAPVNLSESDPLKSAMATASDIAQWLDAASFRPDFVAVDTLAQTLGGGDENDAGDISTYLNQLAVSFRDAYGCGVGIVHHSGKADAANPRGSSAIQANTSYLYVVERQGNELSCVLRCQHMKDSAAPPAVAFTWQEIVVGKDDDGDEVKSLYLVQSGGIDPRSGVAAKLREARPWKQTKGEQRAAILLEIVREVSREKGSCPEIEAKELFFGRAQIHADPHRREYFRRAKETLLADGKILFDSSDNTSFVLADDTQLEVGDIPF